MEIPFYQVDAFTNRVFGGNPAAVCVLKSWLPDETLQKIAAENNLPETAFFVKKEGSYELRWFTPSVEIDLCGHATLASAFVIFSFIERSLEKIVFQSMSGQLTVKKDETLYSMDFPSRKPVAVAAPDILIAALGEEPQEVFKARDYLVVFDQDATIENMNPDFDKLKNIQDAFAVIVTAKGKTVDFVSRFFAPNAGITEDPVTGSAHSTLIPFWAKRLGKTKLHAWQVSARGGEIFCEDRGGRVIISGNAVLYSKGIVYL